MKVAAGCKVTIDYEVKIKGGAVIEASTGRAGLLYTQGAGKMLPALEQRIEGMEIGEEKHGEIPSVEAFGAEESWPTKDILRKEFPAGAELALGQVFEARGPTGGPVKFTIIKADADKVQVRFRPPLAGPDLEYRVKVLLIDDPQRRKRASLAPPPPPAAALGVDAEEAEEADKDKSQA